MVIQSERKNKGFGKCMKQNSCSHPFLEAVNPDQKISLPDLFLGKERKRVTLKPLHKFTDCIIKLRDKNKGKEKCYILALRQDYMDFHLP